MKSFKKIAALIVALVCILSAFAVYSSAKVTSSDPLQVTSVQFNEKNTVIMRFNKPVTVDTTKIFGWFGYDMGAVETSSGAEKINMSHGQKSAKVSSDGYAIIFTFENDPMPFWLDRDNTTCFVVHMDSDTAIVSGEEKPTYEKAELYQDNGSTHVGTLTRVLKFNCSERVNNVWRQGSAAAETVSITSIEMLNDSVLLVNFDKPVTLNTPDIFSWFGHKTADTDPITIKMDYGTSKNTIVNDGMSMRVEFDEGVVKNFMSKVDGEYYFVFHENYDGALASTYSDRISYKPVTLDGTGTLGFSYYVKTSEITKANMAVKSVTLDGNNVKVTFDSEIEVTDGKFFGWFGYSLGNEEGTNNIMLNMSYGQKGYEISSDKKTLIFKFDEGVAADYFSRSDKQYYFVFHQDADAAVRSTLGHTTEYENIVIYNSNGENKVGTTGRGFYYEIPMTPPETSDTVVSVAACAAVMSAIALAVVFKKHA